MTVPVARTIMHNEPQDNFSLSIRDLLYVFFKRKTQIFFVFFGIVGSVLAASLLMSPVYESRASLLVKLGMENVYVPTLPTSGEQSPLVSLDYEREINSEIAILRSRTLLKNLVASLGADLIYPDLSQSSKPSLARLLPGIGSARDPHDEALLRLADAISVAHIPASNVIEIRYSHETPEIAAQVLNELIKLFLERHVQVHKSFQAQDFFRQEAHSLRGKVQQAEKQLEAFINQHGITDPEAQGAILLNHLARVRSAFDVTFSESAQLKSRLQELRVQLAATPRTTVLHKDVAHTPELVRKLKGHILELELKEGDLVNQFRDDGRVMKSVRDEIGLARQKLAEYDRTETIVTRSGVNESYKHIEEALHQSEADFTALQARQSAQSAQLDRYRKEITSLNSIKADYELLAQNLERHKRSYQLYMDKYEESLISDALASKNITNVHVIEPAHPPLTAKSPRVLLNSAIALVIGVFVSLGLALFRGYLDDTLETEEDVQRSLGLPVLASVPAMSRTLGVSFRNASTD